jgi:hypothetical protein
MKTIDPVERALDEAPMDDEPGDDDFDGGLTEARADAKAGRGLTTEELRGELGLPPPISANPVFKAP